MSGPAIVAYISAAYLLLQLSVANRYGYFGDELYHMACGEHLAWGYVDQPPFIALVAWLTRHLFGTSLFAVHLFPAFAGCAMVWLTGLLARELGGQRFAQVLAALCTSCAGVYLITFHILTMNAFEPLLWMGCAYLVIRVIKTGDQRLWLWFGVLAGIGLENKYSIAFFVFGIVAGLLFTRQRKAFAAPWIWVAAGIAFVIFLPNLLWNVQHHWPFLELMHNIRTTGRDLPFTPLGYIRAQILMMTPATAPVWLIGVAYFFFWKTGKLYRVLGWTYLVVLTMFIVLHGKDYYTAPVYPVLFAGGAIAIGQFATRRRMGWIKPASVVAVLAVTLALLPLFLPVLSPERFLHYQAKLPFKIQPDQKSMLFEPLPHHFCMCFGWEETVRAVATTYAAIPPEERPGTAIFANNFATAGAIDLIGPRYGLPKAIGGHQNYWLWGPRNYSGRTVIIVGSSIEDAQHWFNDVTVMAQIYNPYAAPWQNGPVLLCRKPRSSAPMSETWIAVKNWD
jgi:4-amino-4-deoxy-L-arabinose transferase-like glycosyltransferase